MIDIKELRIGNWIAQVDGDKNPVQLSLQIMYDCFIGKDSLFNYDYVELTPKILENFGWKQDEKYIGEYSIQADVLTKIDALPNGGVFTIIINQSDKEFNTNDSVILKNDIEYLHQLQNLFHSLTGIELNDVVAYNYYLELCKDNNNVHCNFEEFISVIKLNKDKTHHFIKDYSFGDLPPNLFL